MAAVNTSGVPEREAFDVGALLAGLSTGTAVTVAICCIGTAFFGWYTRRRVSRFLQLDEPGEEFRSRMQAAQAGIDAQRREHEMELAVEQGIGAATNPEKLDVGWAQNTPVKTSSSRCEPSSSSCLLSAASSAVASAPEGFAKTGVARAAAGGLADPAAKAAAAAAAASIAAAAREAAAAPAAQGLAAARGGGEESGAAGAAVASRAAAPALPPPPPPPPGAKPTAPRPAAASTAASARSAAGPCGTGTT